MGLEKLKVKELRQMCKDSGLKGYSKMKKIELISLLSSLESPELKLDAIEQVKSPTPEPELVVEQLKSLTPEPETKPKKEKYINKYRLRRNRRFLNRRNICRRN